MGPDKKYYQDYQILEDNKGAAHRTQGEQRK
jgi:hypothetical protein